MRFFLLFLAACGAADMAPMQRSEEAEPPPPGAPMPEAASGGAYRDDMPAAKSAAPAVAMDEGEMGGLMDGRMGKEKAESKPSGDVDADKDGDQDQSSPTRSWFPETFLWAPAVVTDASGLATVSFTVPDSLTTWRILALAASRDGNQAGDLHTFSSTLPVYVDPLVPPMLRLGDAVELPINVVNTTESAVRTRLNVSAAGLSGAGGGEVSVPAYGSAVQWVSLKATQPGPASVRAALGGSDAVQRELVVVPTGRKITQSRSGLLGSGENLEISAPPNAEAARVRLTLYPGPVGVVRAELTSAPSRLYSVDQMAYAFAIGASGGGLLEALGSPPDDANEEALRELRLRAQQGLVKAARAPDLRTATTILAAVSRGQDPVSERLTARLREQLLSAQLPDGSWEVPSGSQLQRLLATTAWTAAVVDDVGARVRASAVIERYADRLLDPQTGDAYTAALVLRANLGTNETRDALKELIRGAISVSGTGDSRVTLPDGVQRADGAAPSPAEVEALVALVLDDDAAKDMAATVMSRYQPGVGFGDGYAGLAALDALAELGKQQAPESMDVVLKVDGQEVARHTVSAAAETAVLSAAAPRAGSHTYEIVSEGAWPGLAWHLDLEAWVPWTGKAGPDGLEIEVEHGSLAMGQPVDISLKASGPHDRSMLITHAPPVGFRVDPASVKGGTLVSLDDETITVRVDGGSGLAEVRYTAVPTLSGSLSTGAASVELDGLRDAMAVAPPERWVVP